MAKYITANSLDADDLKWQYINKTDRWNVFWEADDGDMPCPLSYDFIHLCRFIKEDTDPPHLQNLENGRRACVRPCAHGRWYLIQVKANAGVENDMHVAFEFNDKMQEVTRVIHSMESGGEKVFFIDLHEVGIDKAGEFINKMRWQVIKTASSLDLYIHEKQVLYLDGFNCSYYLSSFDKMTMNEKFFYRNVEWLFIQVNESIMANERLLIHELVDERYRFGKKTVLVNFKSGDDFLLLSKKDKVYSIKLNDKDLVKKGGEHE